MAGAAATWREAGAASAGWLVAAAALYIVTGAQGPMWGDPSKLTLYALAGYLPSLNPGDHAGWTAIAAAWLRVAGGDPVVAAHRLSALAGALAVAALPALLLRLGRDRAEAHTAAVLLLVAHPLWAAAGVAETYAPALSAVLLGALAAAAGGAWLLLAGLLWGLAGAIHVVALALVAPLAWTLARRRLHWLLPGALAALAPLWLAFFVPSMDPLTGFAASGVGTWSWHVGAFVDPARAAGNAALVAALAAYALGPLGAWALWRGRGARRPAAVWWVALGALAALLLVYARYRVHLLLLFPLAALLVVRGAHLPVMLRWAHVLVQAAIYTLAPMALAAAGRASLGVRELPHRDNARSFLDPVRRGDRGVEAYLQEAAACLPAGAIVLADFNVGAPLVLAQRALVWRPDVAVEPVAVDVALGARDPAAALAATARAAASRGPAAFADTWEPYYRLREVAASLCLERCGPLALVRDCPR
jgi:hypothetical protein